MPVMPELGTAVQSGMAGADMLQSGMAVDTLRQSGTAADMQAQAAVIVLEWDMVEAVTQQQDRVAELHTPVEAVTRPVLRTPVEAVTAQDPRMEADTQPVIKARDTRLQLNKPESAPVAKQVLIITKDIPMRFYTLYRKVLQQLIPHPFKCRQFI